MSDNIEALSMIIYTVKTLRSGQPRPYADTEREYLIQVEREEKPRRKPWVLYGDVEKRITEEEKMRAEGKLFGGQSPDQMRAQQKDWAKGLVRALCQNFREVGDDDGRTDMGAYFYPTLKSLVIDPKAGTIRAFIVEPYTD